MSSHTLAVRIFVLLTFLTGGILVTTFLHSRNRDVQALRESKTRLQQIANNVRQAVWLENKAQVIYMSPGFETIYGHPLAAIYANPLLWLECIHPDDRERIQQIYAVCRFDEEDIFDETFRIIRPDGTVRWISSRIVPALDSKESCLAVGIAEDITERKHIEHQLLSARTSLEKRVDARTTELRRIVQAMAGRELRMAELKQRIQQLEEQLSNTDISSAPPANR
jgi:PAS domain S-box-containing protein